MIARTLRMASNSQHRQRRRKLFWAKRFVGGPMTGGAGIYVLPASAQFFPFDDRFFNPRPQQPVRPPVQEDFTPRPRAKARRKSRRRSGFLCWRLDGRLAGWWS